MGIPEHYFGEFGGRWVAEPLMSAIIEVGEAWKRLRRDPEFMREYHDLLRNYAGRPSLLTEAPCFAEGLGARVFLKREDLNHTGSHKINNVLGQALLTRELGKTRIIAETGAGQHGVATATAAALLGLECTIYMGKEDTERQALNVARMQMLGAKVIGVTQGSQTLKDAINEAFRDWVTNVETTNYVFGTAAGPDPFPAMVRDLQRVISDETKYQFLTTEGRLPDAVLACVGGGSNAIGSFAAFIDNPEVALIGCEAAGKGLGTGMSAASINAGEIGILHGARTYVEQERDGQIKPSYSISAGLDYPAVGPQHAHLSASKRAHYLAITDEQAMEAFSRLCRTEGIIPALESSHALAGALRWREANARLQEIGMRPIVEDGEEPLIVVTLSGRGDKDMETAAAYFGLGTATFDVIDPSAQGGHRQASASEQQGNSTRPNPGAPGNAAQGSAAQGSVPGNAQGNGATS